MGDEVEAKAVGEGLHLGSDPGVRAGPRCDHHAGVVDHATACRSAEAGEGLGQERLGVEAVVGGIDLGVQLTRVAQHHRGTLHAASSPADHDVVGRGIVLHLLAGSEVVLAGAHLGPPYQRVPPAEGGQRRVAHPHPLALELFVDAHQVALATLHQGFDPFAMRRELLQAQDLRNRSTPFSPHAANGVARHAHGAGNRTHPVSSEQEPQDGLLLLFIEHHRLLVPVLPAALPGPRRPSASPARRGGRWPWPRRWA